MLPMARAVLQSRLCYYSWQCSNAQLTDLALQSAMLKQSVTLRKEVTVLATVGFPAQGLATAKMLVR